MIWIFLLAILVVGATVFISSLYVVKHNLLRLLSVLDATKKSATVGFMSVHHLESIKLLRVCNCVSCKARL